MCFQGTDTRVRIPRTGRVWSGGTEGPAAVPEDQAEAMVYQMFGSTGTVPNGVVTVPVRVCAECVRKCPASFPEPELIASGFLSVFRHGISMTTAGTRWRHECSL